MIGNEKFPQKFFGIVNYQIYNTTKKDKKVGKKKGKNQAAARIIVGCLITWSHSTQQPLPALG